MKCSNCSETFRTADGLLKHAQFHHNINIFIEKPSEVKNGQTKTKEEKQDQIFIDVIPSESNSMFLDSSKSYNITFSSSNLDSNNNETCNQTMQSKSAASLDHNESTNSSCDSSQNTNQKSLDPIAQTPSKPKNVESKEKKTKSKANASFFCDICHAAFNQKIHLTKHSAKHTGIKPFKCSECNYSTVERSHLKVHVRVHTGEKPFKCSHCEYATAQSSTLKIHKKRHHEKSENQSNTKPTLPEPSPEVEEEKKTEIIKIQPDFRNLPPTKRFKNISQMESMNKSDQVTTKDDNRLLGLAKIALEREDPKTTT